MIIHDLYVVCVSIVPHKTNAPLIVNADTVLSRTISLQWMKSVAGRYSQSHLVRSRYARETTLHPLQIASQIIKLLPNPIH
jgi:hypothetical protein